MHFSFKLQMSEFFCFVLNPPDWPLLLSFTASKRRALCHLIDIVRPRAFNTLSTKFCCEIYKIRTWWVSLTLRAVCIWNYMRNNLATCLQSYNGNICQLKLCWWFYMSVAILSGHCQNWPITSLRRATAVNCFVSILYYS